MLACCTGAAWFGSEIAFPTTAPIAPPAIPAANEPRADPPEEAAGAVLITVVVCVVGVAVLELVVAVVLELLGVDGRFAVLVELDLELPENEVCF